MSIVGNHHSDYELLELAAKIATDTNESVAHRAEAVRKFDEAIGCKMNLSVSDDELVRTFILEMEQ